MAKKIAHREVLERYCPHVDENVVLIESREGTRCLSGELCRGRDDITCERRDVSQSDTL